MRRNYEPLGQKSTTCVFARGTDEELVITGFKSTVVRSLLFWSFSVITVGLVPLWIYWRPVSKGWRYERCPLVHATVVSVKDSYGVVEFCHVLRIIDAPSHEDITEEPGPTASDSVSRKRSSRLSIAPGRSRPNSEIGRPEPNSEIDGSRQDSETGPSRPYSNTDRSRSTSEAGPPFTVVEDLPGGGGSRNDLVIRLFVFRGMRFVYNESLDDYSLLNGLDGRVRCWELIQRYYGWTDEEQEYRRRVFGENVIDVKVPSYWTLFYKEVLNPFYVFQICSLVLWAFDDYYIYAVCVLIMSIISIAFELYEIRSQMQSLHEMAVAVNGTSVTIRRSDNVTRTVASGDLAPGDILVVSAGDLDGFIAPCDAVLLNGSCIADESILTGESVPVVKIPLTANEMDELFDADKHQKHVVFCGTKIVQTQLLAGGDLLCVIVRTGFTSAKGSLVRSVLYPKMIQFEFYRDSMLFLAVLAVIALAGMVYTMTVFTVRGMIAEKVISNSLDIITIVVPPTLPAAMAVGIWYSQRRLKSKGIYSTSPQRINLCGKMNLVCFDKTGTLTEEGLELNGVFPSHQNSFMDLVDDLSSLEFGPLLSCLVTCHNLAMVNGALIGDSMDLRIFESTKWIMEVNPMDTFAPTVVKPTRSGKQGLSGTTNMEELMEFPPLELGILRQFPFSPGLQRCTVIARRLGDFPVAVYCKGAPEKIAALCKPETVPPEFGSLVDKETMLGHRVLALSFRYLPKKTPWHHLQRMKREDLERDLEFLGIVVFRNRLKPSTTSVIRELRRAGIRCVMVTGDSLLTSLCVARECSLIKDYEEVYTVNADDSSSLECPLRISCRTYPSSMEVSGYSYQNSGPFSGVNGPLFAISGPDFALIRDRSPDVLRDIVSRGVVFARMRPEQKAQLVETFQELGFIVGMCGDGANDCSALKAAHAGNVFKEYQSMLRNATDPISGVSLSDLEASVAAPFTCRVPTIECIPELIKEGRCALVTSFGVFKCMTMYSMIQFVSVLTLYSMNFFLADNMYLFIDLAIITVIALLMGRTEPSTKLDRKQPSAKLLSVYTVSSVLTHVFVLTMAQLLAVFYLHSRKWYGPVYPDPNDELSVSWETTTVFFVSSFQYLIMALVFSGGYPYRKPFYTNYPFVAALLFFTLALTFTLFARVHFLDSWLELIPIPRTLWRFQLSLILMTFLNLAFSLLVEFMFSHFDVDTESGRALPFTVDIKSPSFIQSTP